MERVRYTEGKFAFSNTNDSFFESIRSNKSINGDLSFNNTFCIKLIEYRQNHRVSFDSVYLLCLADTMRSILIKL